MADEQQPLTSPSNAPGMFAEPPREKQFPTTAVAIASVAIVILVGFLLLLGHRKGGDDVGSTPQAAAYASNLVTSDLKLSESGSLSGGKVTYVDGRIANHGNSTVAAATAQVSFPNDAGTDPQVMTVPLNLIRMREPYIDTQPLSASPLAPGAEADFRLIFEGVSENWNNKPPDIKFVRIVLR